jgi:hypothetical protein
MRHAFSIMIWSAISLIVAGCIDQIPFPDVGARADQYVFQGLVELGAESARLEVYINRLAPFDETAPPAPVDGAEVRVRNDRGQEIELPPAGAGRYATQVEATQAFEVAPGLLFQLSARLPGGARYESSWEPLPAAPAPSALSFSRSTRQELNAAGNIVARQYVDFFLRTPLLAPGHSERAYLKWDFIGAFELRETPPMPPAFANACYVENPVGLNQVVIFNGQAANADTLSNFAIYSEPLDFRFSFGYYLTALQRSLSPGAYRYWEQVREIVARQGGLFDPVPGPVLGNVRNVDEANETVAGYFYAVSTDTVRVFVNFEGGDRPVPYCDEPAGGGVGTSVCVDCLNWPNSTRQRPHYWQ